MKDFSLNIKKLTPDATIPTYGTEFSAGADLYLCGDDITIRPHTTVLAHTGIAMAIPGGFVGLVFARSGLASKKDLAPANKVGVIDSDYRGEIMVALHNHGEQTRTVERGERIAQIVFVPYSSADFCVVDELDDTVRGDGGFGSTGRK